MPLRLVVGLGNPGPRYAETRHNMGFRVVDTLRERQGGGPWRGACESLVSECRGSLVLAKPQTYVNRSGLAAGALLARWPVEVSSLLVVHDDLDLPFGALRVRIGGGHGGHKGIRSLVEVLGTGDFLRLKIGIGRPASKDEVVDYVLSPFAPDEAAALPAVLGRAADAADCILAEGPAQAMSRFHS